MMSELAERCRLCKFAFAQVRMYCGAGHHVYVSTGQCSAGFSPNRKDGEFSPVPSIRNGLRLELERYRLIASQTEGTNDRGTLWVKIDVLERALAVLEEYKGETND